MTRVPHLKVYIFKAVRSVKCLLVALPMPHHVISGPCGCLRTLVWHLTP